MPIDEGWGFDPDSKENKLKITTVYSFPNGQTMVFDQFGKQMPEFQGRTEEVMPKIREAGFTGENKQCDFR